MALICESCSTTYDPRNSPRGCPECGHESSATRREFLEARTRQEARRAATLAAEHMRCTFTNCTYLAMTLGLCAEHWHAFSSAPEYSRARTALSDFVQRSELERRNETARPETEPAEAVE